MSNYRMKILVRTADNKKRIIEHTQHTIKCMSVEKKKNSWLPLIMTPFIIIATLLFLSTFNKNTEPNLLANAADFNDFGFTNKYGQVIAKVEDGLLISGELNPANKSRKQSSIDIFLQKQNIRTGESFLHVYENAEIITNGNIYTIMINNQIVMKFEKIADRIIKDSNGIEYQTSMNSRE